MPSHSVKQAKVMSAIAHGWHPSGLDIPIKVAKEFHAADAGHKYGKGHDKKKADGGRAALDVAYAEKRRARAEGGQVHEGPIISTVPGRTDHHPMDVASGSYVIPAESVSHLGENNTLAGLDRLKRMGPHGLKRLVRSCGGSIGKSVGGAANSGDDGSIGRPVPIQAAGGEFVVPPEWVHHIGDGDMKKGHKLLDNWVMSNRKKHINTLKALKPPAKD